MNKKSKDQYITLFQGAKLPKREANKVGIGLIFGLLGAVLSGFLFGLEYKIAAIIICGIFVGFGYFIVGNKLFKS